MDEMQNETVIEGNLWTIEPPETIGDEIKGRFKEFVDYTNSIGFRDKWIKIFNYYIGRYVEGSNKTGLERVGPNGETLVINTNHVNALIKSVLGILSNNPPTFDTVATNSDVSSSQLASLNKNLLDYYMRHPTIRLRERFYRAAEHAFIFAAGFTLVEWDPTTAEEGETDGDILVTNPTVFDLCFDPHIDSWEELDWFIVRQFKPRVQMLRRFPEFQNEINNTPTKDSFDYTYTDRYNPSAGKLNDSILTYKLFHRKTEELPNGRLVWLLGDGKVLIDTDLPYDRVPLERLILDDIPGTPFGRTPVEDIVPLQEAHNVLSSAILTNLGTLAYTLVEIPEGSDISGEDVGGGIRLIRTPQGSQGIRGVTLTTPQPEVYQHITKLEQDMNALIGLSAVSRGATPSSLQSGSALALAASMSAQNQGPLLNNYNDFISRVATTIIKILRTYAINDRTIAILGKNKSKQVLFNQDDLQAFDRVTVVPGNPMTATMAGRMQIAQDLLGQGLITPQDFFTVLSTGNLDQVQDAGRDEEDLIGSENEALMEGKPVQVLALDDHNRHIMRHRSILNNVDFRMPIQQNPQVNQVLEATLTHIQEHMGFMQGQPSPVTNNPQGAMPKPDNAEPAVANPINQENMEAGITGPTNPALDQAKDAGTTMPQPPKNPLTGERSFRP